MREMNISKRVFLEGKSNNCTHATKRIRMQVQANDNSHPHYMEQTGESDIHNYIVDR